MVARIKASFTSKEAGLLPACMVLCCPHTP
jgi:hypothetical protein